MRVIIITIISNNSNNSFIIINIITNIIIITSLAHKYQQKQKIYENKNERKRQNDYSNTEPRYHQITALLPTPISKKDHQIFHISTIL